MARQKVILLHTSGTSYAPLTGSSDVALSLGEIAVQHNAGKPELIIRLDDGNGGLSGNLAHFIDQAAITTLINSAQTTLQTAIGELDTRLGSGVTAASSATQQFEAAAEARTALGTRLAAAENEISALTASASSLNDAIEAETSARTSADTALGTRIDGTVTDIATINGKLGSGFTSDSTVASQLAAVKSTADSAIQTVGATGDTYLTLTATPDGTSVGITGTLDMQAVSSATSANTGLAEAFETKSYVDAQIAAIAGGESGESLNKLRTDINAVSGMVGTGFSTTVGETVTDRMEAVEGIAETALQEISASTTVDPYVTVNVSTKNSGDTAQTVGVSAKTVDVSAATAQNKGLAEASDVKAYVDGQITNIDTTSDVATLKQQLAGFATDSGSVKTYVDDAVSDAITSVYKVKGSVDTYAQLPSTNPTEGDVYNVVCASTVDSKVYPAGTNFVWVSDGENTGHWDPLGGTVDLSPYMQTNTFESWTAGTYTTKMSNLDSSISGINDKIGTVPEGSTVVGMIGSAQTAADAALTGITSAASTHASVVISEKANKAQTIAVNVTTHAIDSASADTDGLATAFAVKNAISAATSGVSDMAQDISDLKDVTSGYTGANAIKNAVEECLTGVTSTGSSSYATVTVGTKANRSQDITVAVAHHAVSSATADSEGFATAFDVKTVTDGLNTKITTVSGAASTNATNITSLQEVTSGYTGVNAIKNAIDALGGSVQSVEVHNTANNKITATEDSGHTVTLNFDEMVIDCGTYGA